MYFYDICRAINLLTPDSYKLKYSKRLLLISVTNDTIIYETNEEFFRPLRLQSTF